MQGATPLPPDTRSCTPHLLLPAWWRGERPDHGADLVHNIKAHFEVLLQYHWTELGAVQPCAKPPASARTCVHAGRRDSAMQYLCYPPCPAQTPP